MLQSASYSPRQRFPRKTDGLCRGVSLFSSILLASVFASCPSFGIDTATADRGYQSELLPLLRTYCFDCHDSDSDISLADDTSAEAIAKNRDFWRRALAQVQLGTMPPEDGETMDASSRQRMIQWMDELSSAVDCVRNPNAGKVALRRLNRNEYRNTVRDLTGIDYKPAADFPGDDVGYGFDNIGDVLSLPPILLEKYLDAAEVITGKAIYTPPPPELFEINKTPGDLLGAEKFGVRSGRLTLASSGTVTLPAKLPFGGRYSLIITASGDQGGNEPVKMQVECGRRNQTFDVSNDQPAEFSFDLRVGQGNRKFDISFLNDYYKNGQDRNLHIHHIELRGTETASRSIPDSKLPPSHRAIIFSKPSGDRDADQATSAVINRMASRAFRRPATEHEIERLTSLAASVRRDGGSYEEGIQVALQAILVSPHFLFKVEKPREAQEGQPMPEISQYELATRISYFLWSSMPDDELLLLAHRGQLRDRKVLLNKVAKMMRDPRANRFVDHFASQWLQLRNLETVEPDQRLFRSYNAEVRDLMRRETLTFFAGIMRENLPVTELLEADFTYVNEDLAKYYGLPDVRGDHFRKVSLVGTRRGGLLTHASVLTITSNPTRTSPVKRGKWILDNLLGTPPPPAPPNIPELEKGQLTGTLRERMEQHRENPACAACHNMMDPLGFAMENFDAVGNWRTIDAGQAIDSSGNLPDGTRFDGIDQLKTLLAETRKEQFVRCLTDKLMTYAIGRGTEYYDKCAIDKIVTYAGNREYRFAYLIAGIIQSDPFQKQGFR
ncbi:MAG: DUF1592 domain-containing protein [Planctomycetota bacterium]